MLTPLNDFISSATHTFCYAVLKQLLLAISSLKIGLKVVNIICEVQFGAEVLLLPERRTCLHVYNDRHPGLQLLSGYLCGVTVIVRSVGRPLYITSGQTLKSVTFQAINSGNTSLSLWRSE